MFSKTRRDAEGLVEALETYDGRLIGLPEAVSMIKSELFDGISGNGQRGKHFMKSYLDWLAEREEHF